ncbi:hypothetical protein [Butyrivibrio sp. AC2005]|uniref:hypothetical protein n=1 Tax=Butyrivibrio sp. AC2005 TaxID=1280672 RepID=UPI00041E4F8E|nr:hypothetical protein [Butyrivibrio sp. AC2005]
MMKFSMAKKVMSLTLAMLVSASVAMPGFNNSITVKAESNAKTITGLGTGTIGNPANGAGQWDYVYYGKYNDLNVKYRVLDTDCDDFSDYGNLSKNTVLLDCDNVLYHLRPGSAAKLLENLNDQGFLDAGVFTDAEKEAIALSRKERKSTDDGEGVDGDFAQLKEMKIFALDPKEATNPTYGYKNQKDDLNRIKRNISTDEKENWWLRLGKDGRFQNIIAKEMYKTDKLIGRIKTEPADSSEGVSPAFNLKKESILFSSLVSGSSNEYKLTLIDDSMKSLKDVKCKKSDDEATISFKYPYETVDDSVSFSVVLLKDRYERGKTVDNSSEFAYIPITLSSEGQVGSGKNKYHMMSGTFKLPEQSSGLKFAYLIYEKNNGSKETDYACAPKFFELDSENHVHAWEIDYLGAGDDNATVRCKDCSEKYKISIVAASKQYGDDVSVTINKPDDLPDEIQVSDVIYRDGNGRDIDKSEVGEVGEYTAVAVISVVDENGDNQEV